MENHGPNGGHFLLFSQGVFEHYLIMSSLGLEQEMISSVIEGATKDDMGLRWKFNAMVWSGNIGVTLLWIAAALAQSGL